MKRILGILLACTMVFALAGCSNGGTTTSQSGDTGSGISSQPEAVSQTSVPASQNEESAPEEGGVLVAYFSWSGNTERVANLIAQQTGGDLFEITPATPYTDDYDTLLDVAQQEQAEDARPALANTVENWDSYDVVFVGYPNWWSDAPMAVYTFLESYDFTGKTLIPFNTSSSGGFGRSLDGVAQSAPGAEMLEGLALTENELDDASNQVSAWISGLGLSR